MRAGAERRADQFFVPMSPGPRSPPRSARRRRRGGGRRPRSPPPRATGRARPRRRGRRSTLRDAAEVEVDVGWQRYRVGAAVRSRASARTAPPDAARPAPRRAPHRSPGRIPRPSSRRAPSDRTARPSPPRRLNARSDAHRANDGSSSPPSTGGRFTLVSSLSPRNREKRRLPRRTEARTRSTAAREAVAAGRDHGDVGPHAAERCGAEHRLRILRSSSWGGAGAGAGAGGYADPALEPR